MKKHLKSGAIVLAAAGLFAAGGMSTAVAAKMITGAQIKDGSIHSVDLSDGVNNKLEKHTDNVSVGQQGPAGKDGKDGKDGLAGAIYRVENYKNGGGGDATVACADDPAVSQTYTAIAGGVEDG